MKKRIIEFDFIRALCALGIIAYHFSVGLSEGAFIPFAYHANGKYSHVVVGMFFILSGATLYLKHHEIDNLKKFYYKRWISLFPAFYLIFIFLYVRNVIQSHSLFYLGRPWTLLLSIVGMDGYFSYKIPNYYMIGEWFLGAIILLYILYPFILKLFNKNDKLTYGMITILLIIQSYSTFFTINANRNLITCIFYLISGMMIMKYRLYVNKYWSILGGIISVLLIMITIPLNSNITCAIMAIGAFLGLSYIGRMVMNNKVIAQLFSWMSGISYYTFLIQHLVILAVQTKISVKGIILVLGLLGITTVIILLLAWLFKEISDILIKRIDSLFQKIAF